MKKTRRISKLTALILLVSAVSVYRAQTNPSLNWQVFSGSVNIFNSLRPFAKPLHYEPHLNLVSFIQRKSATYTCSPDPGVSGQSGVIVAMLSGNWGNQWDSTCLWTNPNYYGRYPQGAVYNPPGNSSISNAYCVSMGPVVTTQAFSGFFTASKILGPGSYNNSPGTASNSMQYFPDSSSLGWCYYAGNAFSVSGDGVAHSLGYLSDPLAAHQYRGAMLLKGNYANNAFTWSSDSLVCSAAYYGGGYKSMNNEAMMTWNQDGTVGYVVFMASRYGSEASNRGWQPMVYKSINSGNSWTLAPSMDFNSSGALFLKQRLAAIEENGPNAGLIIPQVQCEQGWDLTVDKNDALHVFALLNGARTYHLDSINSKRYYGNEGYNWEHQPGRRPYLADFILSSSGNWSYGIVDSLGSEAPASGSGPGSNYNPWNAGGNSNVVTNLTRVQCSRSPDSRYILVSWAESDTTQTSQHTKWNSKPNIKVRLIDGDTYHISTTELDISVNSGTLVSGRASMHFMSPVSGSAQLSGGQIHIPVAFTLSNEENYSTLLSCEHWFAGDSLRFSDVLIPFTQTIAATSLDEVQSHWPDAIRVFPNPFSNRIQFSGFPANVTTLQIQVFDLLGRTLFDLQLKGTEGEIDLGHLPEGLYLMSISTEQGNRNFRILKE